MKIAELQPRQGKVDVEVTVAELQQARTIAKPGFSGKVQNAKVRDDSGTVTVLRNLGAQGFAALEAPAGRAPAVLAVTPLPLTVTAVEKSRG